MCILPVAFPSVEQILWILSMHQVILFLHPRSSHLRSVLLQQYVQWCTCCSGNVDVLQRKKKWFFLRHREFDSGFSVMTINEFSCNSPEVTFSLLIIPALNLLEVELENVIHLIFLEEFLGLLLVPDAPGLRWMFSDAVHSQRFWLFHLRLGIWSFHFFAALTLPLHWAFGRGVLMRPSPPIPQCLATIMSPFQILPACNA